jgi:hypothetical protein
MNRTQYRVIVLSYVRRSVGQSVHIWGHHLESATNSYFSFVEILLRQFLFHYYGGASLRREQICNYQCSHSSVSVSFHP